MTMLITGETWGENLDAVRAYLLSEAELPITSLRPKLESAHAELMAALDGVSDAQARFTPVMGEGEDAWGIAEVLRHIGTVEPTMAQRIRLLATGQSVDGLPRGQSGSMADLQTRRISELREALERSYAQLLGALSAIEGSERPDAVAAHRRFGELNCRGWVALHTAHLHDHARQIDKIKHMDGYPAGE